VLLHVFEFHLQVILHSLYVMFVVIQAFESSKQDHTRSWLYGLCSLSYLGAMVSSNSALQYVNYPTQVCSSLLLYRFFSPSQQPAHESFFLLGVGKIL